MSLAHFAVGVVVGAVGYWLIWTVTHPIASMLPFDAGKNVILVQKPQQPSGNYYPAGYGRFHYDGNR